MKNKRWLRMTGWLIALVMILTVYPIATFAEGTGENLVGSEGYKPVVALAEQPAEVDIADLATITYTDASGKDVTISDMDPNKENRVKVAVSGLEERYDIGDETNLVITLSGVKIKGLDSFSNDAVGASVSDNKLILSWKNGKQNSVEASFDVMPNLPADHDLSGSYALVTKTNVMVGSKTWSDGGRQKLTSYKAQIKDGKVQPEADERSIWVLKHVSGDYYTVYSQTAGKYLKLVLSNHATLEETNEANAQKLLVKRTNDGFYTFYFNGVNLNNSGNNATKGFASYTAGNADNEKFSLYPASDVLYMDRIIFNVNGGTGAIAPEMITAEPGTKITLPDLDATKSGERFIGWADESNFYAQVRGTNHTYHNLYKAGTQFTVSAGTKTLYAVYNPTVKTVQFGIRKDGIIQDEPNGYDVKNYIGHFKVDGILKEGRWVIDIDATKPVNDYYVENNVTAALNWVPSAEEIAAALMKEGKVVFDPETQYVHYYVLKCTSATVWKVDGVIRNREKVGVTYNVNVPGEEKTKISNMPGGYQVVSGTEILLGTSEGTNTVQTPERSGYVFTGWNTKADGTGTSYPAGTYMRLKNNLNLYAQWADVERELTINLESSLPNGQPAPNGTIITLTAKLSGFENMVEGTDYILQWQYSTDQENWIDVTENGNGHTYTFELNVTTAQYTWRVIAREVK